MRSLAVRRATRIKNPRVVWMSSDSIALLDQSELYKFPRSLPLAPPTNFGRRSLLHLFLKLPGSAWGASGSSTLKASPKDKGFFSDSPKETLKTEQTQRLPSESPPIRRLPFSRLSRGSVYLPPCREALHILLSLSPDSQKQRRVTSIEHRRVPGRLDQSNDLKSAAYS